ncbi:hypothetical protein Y1Q_0020694 [Alligator mississippiensis]|uniref:Uncharacterized protein n=1 Tax=Alligator mississippiensis TaxID=8496 RepID=A0A151NYJ4_ALLMI|nr:hypothetical protein Y1Q_0020694 [Alligator mississippiensis]
MGLCPSRPSVHPLSPHPCRRLGGFGDAPRDTAAGSVGPGPRFRGRGHQSPPGWQLPQAACVPLHCPCAPQKGRGDVKKAGRPDPYAYIPLNRAKLNRRKKAKLQGQFKGLMKGAQRGAQAGHRHRPREPSA